MNTYSPMDDRVLVRPIKKTEPEITEAGLIIDMQKKEVMEGEVVESGIGFVARDTGVFVPNTLKKGDIVLCGVNAGQPITIDNGNGKEEVRVMREGDVIAVIKKSS